MKKGTATNIACSFMGIRFLRRLLHISIIEICLLWKNSDKHWDSILTVSMHSRRLTFLTELFHHMIYIYRHPLPFPHLDFFYLLRMSSSTKGNRVSPSIKSAIFLFYYGVLYIAEIPLIAGKKLIKISKPIPSMS